MVVPLASIPAIARPLTVCTVSGPEPVGVGVGVGAGVLFDGTGLGAGELFDGTGTGARAGLRDGVGVGRPVLVASEGGRARSVATDRDGWGVMIGSGGG